MLHGRKLKSRFKTPCLAFFGLILNNKVYHLTNGADDFVNPPMHYQTAPWNMVKMWAFSAFLIAISGWWMGLWWNNQKFVYSCSQSKKDSCRAELSKFTCFSFRHKVLKIIQEQKIQRAHCCSLRFIKNFLCLHIAASSSSLIKEDFIWIHTISL